MTNTLLSTTEVAKILSVTPDTVLKWVRTGKIKSFRTPGGHSRIPKEQVTCLLDKPNHLAFTAENEEQKTHQYCWELLAKEGEIKEQCKECITYRSRAKRCYELRDLPGDIGCLRMYCLTSCEHCDYFKLMNGSKVNVLILSESSKILTDDKTQVNSPVFNLKFVKDEYECSLRIEKYRPDFIIIDTSLGKKRTSTLCNHFFDDARIPVARIILTSNRKQSKEICDQEIFGWIKKPFSVQELKDYITGIQYKIDT
jgi:excisionase family DNA binding protein